MIEFEVVGDVAELLLDLAYRLEISRSVEGIPTTEQQCDQVSGYVSACDIEAPGQVVEDCRFVNRDDMRDAVAGVDHYPATEALRVQCQHCLYSDVDAAEVVFLEHDIAHLLAVAQRIHGGFSEEDFAARGVDLHFLVEGEVPEVFHIVPALYYAILHLPLL